MALYACLSKVEAEAIALWAYIERMEREAADHDELLTALLAMMRNSVDLCAIAIEEEQVTEAEVEAEYQWQRHGAAAGWETRVKKVSR
jgi:hypothetical protein